MNESTNPWQVLSEKQVYDNNWITVTEYGVINPGGGKGIYGKVHLKNIAIGVLVLDEELNTYLVGQYRFTVSEYSWEIPEGGGSFDMEPLDSAKKELREETGLIAHEWNLFQKLHTSNSISDEYALIFLARNLEQHDPMPEETEQLVVKKLPLEEAWQLTEKGLITDAISVAAIQKAKIMIMSGELS